jgi:hypothetical protein
MRRKIFINGVEPGERARVNVAEAIALYALCRYEAVCKSEAIRLAIREAAKKRGLWPQGEVQHAASK